LSHQAKKEYRVEYNKIAIIVPVILMVLGGYLLFSENFSAQLRLFGGILVLASGVGIFALSVAYIQAKAIAIMLSEKAEEESQEEEKSDVLDLYKR